MSAIRKKLVEKRREIAEKIEKLVGLDDKGAVREMSKDDEDTVEKLRDEYKALGRRIDALDAARDDDEDDDEDGDKDEDRDDEDEDEEDRDDEDDDEDGDKDKRSRSSRKPHKREASRRGRSTPKFRHWQRDSPAVHTKKHVYSMRRAILAAAYPGKYGRCLETELSDDLQHVYRKQTDGILIPTGAECDMHGNLLYADVPGITYRSRIRVDANEVSPHYLRDVAASTSTGAIFVRPELPFIEILRAQLVLRSLGVQFWTEMDGGKFSIPRQDTAGAVTWNGEMTSGSSAPSSNNPSIAQMVNFTNKTVQVLNQVTRRFLLQSSVNGEQLLRDDMAKVFARGLDAAGINGSGSSNQPLGILQNTTIQTNSAGLALGTNGGTMTWGTITGMQAQIQNYNAATDELRFLSNPTLIGSMKKTAKIGSTFPEYIATGRGGSNAAEGQVAETDGLGIWSTTQVPKNLTKGTTSGGCSALILAMWADAILAQWGGIEVLANPYLYQAQGVIQYSMMSDADFQVRHEESFAIITDAIP